MMPDTTTSLNDDEGCHQDLTLDDDIKEAQRLKEEGNTYFRSKRWEEALAAYKSALGYLPRRRKEERTAPEESDEGAEVQEPLPSGDAGGASSLSSSSMGEASSTDAEFVKARAVLNANIGACHVKLGEHEEAVVACTEAILDDP